MTQLRTIPLAIAAVGMTVDGREIEDKDVEDIVATYKYKKYGARINLDHAGSWSGWDAKHLHGVDLNGGMLGDVLEVFTGTNDDGIKVLYAVLAPNASFVALNNADQAVYFSIEIDRNFMGSEQTYLTGLAVTDYPASTYTDRAKFNARQKSDDDKDVSFLKVDLGVGKSVEAKKFSFKNLFNFTKEEPEMKPEDLSAALKDALGEPLTQFNQALKANTEAIATMQGKFSGDENGSRPKVPADSDEQFSGDQNGTDPKKPAAADEQFSGDENGSRPKGASNDFTQVNDKVTGLETKIDKLTNAFAKALGTPAGDTTDSEEEQAGEHAKYGANFL